MGKVRKDKRFWQVEDRVEGRIGAYYGYRETSTKPKVEGRGIRVQFIPFKDVNSVFSVVPATITNWFSKFIEVFDKKPSVKELGYTTTWDNIEIVNPDDSHLPGVPEKKVIIHADQDGHSKYNRDSELRERVHELEQEKKELEQIVDAKDLQKLEAEQEADRESTDGRKQRREGREVFNPDEAPEYNNDRY
jgi:hypothetical protein